MGNSELLDQYRGAETEKASPMTAQIIPLPHTASTHEDFLKSLFAHAEHPIWLQALGNNAGQFATRNMRDVDLFVARHDLPGAGVYICSSTISGLERTKDCVGEIIGLWLDLDFKDITDTSAEVERKL